MANNSLLEIVGMPCVVGTIRTPQDVKVKTHRIRNFPCPLALRQAQDEREVRPPLMWAVRVRTGKGEPSDRQGEWGDLAR